jgi:hypothetical protein
VFSLKPNSRAWVSAADELRYFGHRDDITPQSLGFEVVDAPEGPRYEWTGVMAEMAQTTRADVEELLRGWAASRKRHPPAN